MYEIFEELLKKNGITAYRVAKETGITTATLTSWKQGKYTPKQEKLQKIADYFGVSIDYLMTGKEALTEQQLTRRDEREIEKILNQTRDQLLSQEGLMFDGMPASQEDIDSILAAMQIGMEMVKKKNKERFTPKKYRKKETNEYEHPEESRTSDKDT